MSDFTPEEEKEFLEVLAAEGRDDTDEIARRAYYASAEYAPDTHGDLDREFATRSPRSIEAQETAAPAAAGRSLLRGPAGIGEDVTQAAMSRIASQGR